MNATGSTLVPYQDTNLLAYALHRPGLVAISIFVGILAAITAWQIVSIARHSDVPLHRRLGVVSGAIVLDVGMWGLHFVSVLGFNSSMRINHSVALNLLSMLPGFLASWVALHMMAQPRVTHGRLIASSILISAGIGAMHFSGMAATGIETALHDAPLPLNMMFMLITTLLTWLALNHGFGTRSDGSLSQRGHRLAGVFGGGTCMGLSIAVAHYGSLYAAYLLDDPLHNTQAHTPNFIPLSIALSVVSVIMMLLLANNMLRLRQAYRRVAEEETRIQTILDTVADGIVTCNEDGVILSFSPAAERILGWSAAEVVGKSCDMLLQPDQVIESRERRKRFVESRPLPGEIPARELPVMHKNGTILPIRTALGIIREKNHTIFVVILSDMSAEHRMEQALAEKAQQFQSLIRNIPGVSFRCRMNEEWTMPFVSNAVTALTGWAPEDFMEGRLGWKALLHPDDVERVSDEVARSIAERRNYEISYRLITRDSHIRWVLEYGCVLIGEDGMPQWSDGVLLDVTENRLRNAEFEGTVRALGRSLAVIEFATDGSILTANDNFLALSGYRMDELHGQKHCMLCDADEVRTPAYENFWQHLTHGEFASGEYRRFGKNGRPFWIQATYNPVYGADGKLHKIVKFATDITPRKCMEADLREAKERAEQAASARAAFLANTSHEIRTPINAIIGFTDVLLDSPLSDEQRRHLEMVSRASRSLLRLLNEVLDTAKLDRGAVELEMENFNLPGLLDEVSSTLAGSARQKGLDLHLHYDPALAHNFNGDALRIRQVTTNLLANAIKFTEAGEINLRVEPDGEQLHFSIRDTGIGIAPERLAAVFEPFTQADSSMSRRFGGTGLGTTIAKQLVELMGGRIWVESTLGVGSTFHFVLPLQEAAANGPERVQFTPLNLPELDILAVDDVPLNLELLRRLLGRLSHRLTLAESGAEAVAHAAASRFDLILMDMQMPQIDGLEATRLIRAHERAAGLPRTPVIALTASVLEADRCAATEAGMDGFAAKPLDMYALTHEMARVCGLLQSSPPPCKDLDAGPRKLCNREDGIARWNGKASAWLGALQRHSIGFTALGHELLKAVAARDLAEAGHLAHRLRGAAANLSLEQLSDALTHIERMCAPPTSPESIQALDQACAALMQLVDATQQAIRTELDHASPAAPAAGITAPDPLALREAGQRLIHTLAHGELDDDAMATMTSCLPENSPALITLRQLLDDFEFDAAIAHLTSLLATPAPARTREDMPT